MHALHDHYHGIGESAESGGGGGSRVICVSCGRDAPFKMAGCKERVNPESSSRCSSAGECLQTDV